MHNLRFSLGFDLYANSALNLSAVRLVQIFKPVLRSGLKLFVLQHPCDKTAGGNARVILPLLTDAESSHCPPLF
jgi:hypothetical protein